jgi:hypothetical protein
VKRKIGSWKKCAFSSSKVRAALKKQTPGCSANSYCESGKKIQVYHNTVKKYLTKVGVHHRKAKKSTPKTTTRQSVIKARLKLLRPIFFSAKSIYGNEWQHQGYYESEDHPATGDVNFISKTKFPAKILLWLVVSESGTSEPLFSKPI